MFKIELLRFDITILISALQVALNTEKIQNWPAMEKEMQVMLSRLHNLRGTENIKL